MIRNLNLFLMIILCAVLTYACGYSPEEQNNLNTPGSAYQTPSSDLSATGQYIVTFHQESGQVHSRVSALAQKHGFVPQHIFSHAIKGFSARLSPSQLKKLSENPNVKSVEADALVFAFAPPPGKGGGKDKGSGGSGDPCASEPAQVTPSGILRVGGAADGTGKRAWVIDSGIDLDHCDLNVNTSLSANFVTRGKSSPDDGYGHGTHVAGTIAAIDNAIGVVGVAAGAELVSVRVLDKSGSGYISWVVAGVDYVAANASPGDVANLSLGAPGHFQSLHDAIINAANAGIKFSLAAGNDSDHADLYAPAHINHSNVFTVSAVDSNDVFAYFSNYGNPPVDYAAPGVSVLSTKRGGGTTSMSGTSMAAPHVAGLLLFGTPLGTSGTAVNDPDGIPDPIAHY